MRVLVSDNLGEIGIKMFEDEEGIEVDVKTGLSAEEQKAIIGDYDGLVIRSATKVTEDLLSAATCLKVIGRAGIGLDNVDIPAATKRGIIVMNTPDGNVVTTAEHAIAMMLSLTRNIPQGTSSMKDGKWDKKKLQGREIFNKKLGVIGFGKIGSIVADRARGLKMQVLVYDPMVTSDRIEKAGYKSVSLKELYQQADYITIHVPKLKSTEKLLNEEAFNSMKDDVMIINCARGGIVDEKALYNAMVSGKVAGAALDVFETEPPGQTDFIGLKQLITTPHLGASTREAQTNVAIAVASQIIKCLKEGTVLNAVNAPSVTGELLEKLKPFLFLADGIGSLQSQFCKGPVKEIAIEYAGNFKGLDLEPVTIAVIKGVLSNLYREEVNSVNAPVIAKDMGIDITIKKSGEISDYNNLMTVKVVTEKDENIMAGTIFGKNEPRIVKINKFRLELIPKKGNFALIHNVDKPGAIGSIGVTLGENNINIDRMMVGQEDDGERNIIFIRTDTPISEDVLKKLTALPLIKSVKPLEL